MRNTRPYTRQRTFFPSLTCLPASLVLRGKQFLLQSRRSKERRFFFFHAFGVSHLAPRLATEAGIRTAERSLALPACNSSCESSCFLSVTKPPWLCLSVCLRLPRVSILCRPRDLISPTSRRGTHVCTMCMYLCMPSLEYMCVFCSPPPPPSLITRRRKGKYF